MPLRSRVIRRFRPVLDHHQGIKAVLRTADVRLARAYHSLGQRFPVLIKPEPRHLTIAVTAHCNLRCIGCGYGRDFMTGQQLSLQQVVEALTDAKGAGINTVRFYGGEPLLHRDLPKMIERSVGLGFYTYVTTNGTLLKQKIDDLYRAGLRLITIGFYGVGENHSSYTQRGGSFRRLEAGIAAIRERYGNAIELQLNFVLMSASCSVDALKSAWEFSRRFDMYFHVDLVNSIIPFFNTPRSQEVELKEEHRSHITAVTCELLRLKERDPSRVLHSLEFLRSIPDWLLARDKMNVPCDAYQTVWIGADGTVQICDTALKIGNILEHPLREILFRETHKKAARDGFCLNCPKCLCKIETRVQKHARSMRLYGQAAPWEP
jgi:MoaA/NifB/PqqE/SkfB family radical SAM enzyme